MTQPSILEVDAAEGCTLQLEFRWLGDRFQHALRWLSSGGPQEVLTSVEGNAAQSWPPSPALQQLHIEHREAGPVALLVGMAGKSHWSASVEASSDLSGFRFDFACRIQQPAQQLLSSYTTNAAVTSRPHDCVLRLQDGTQILVIPADSSTLEFPCAGGAGVAPNETLVARPTHEATAPPCTCRWAYQIQLGER